jgi:hypothetical protein
MTRRYKTVIVIPPSSRGREPSVGQPGSRFEDVDLMNKHEDTMLEIHELGSRIPPYRPTFDLPAPFIDRSHKGLAE